MRVNMHEPPEPGTFKRVLRRTDKHLGLAANMAVTSYTARIKARAIRHPDGVEALTLFYPDRTGNDAAADRQLRFGWKDVTEMWKGYHVAGDTSLQGMDWHELKAQAEARGIVTMKRKRAAIEADLQAILDSE